LRVVLLDVEADEALHLRHGLQRVREQPAVLERAPPRLDERVAERQVHLGEDAAQAACRHEGVHVAVAVLHAMVGHHGRRAFRGQVRSCLEEQVHGRARVDPVRYAPGREKLSMIACA
jgi:hypothetical protein